MEPKGSLPCSQKLAIGLYPDPAESTLPNRSLLPKGHKQNIKRKSNFLKCFQSISNEGAHPTFYPIGTMGSFPGGKAAGA